MTILDIIILVFIALQAVLGYVKGIVKSLFDLVGYLLAVAVTYFFYNPVKALLIEATPLDEQIATFVAERLKALGATSVQATVSTADLNAMAKLPLPENIKKAISDFLTGTVSSVSQNVTTEVTNFLMTIIAVVSVFIVTIIVIKIVVSMLDIIANLPVISTFNKVGGVLFGLVKSYIIISLLFLVFIMFFSTSGNQALNTMIDQSLLSPFFINYNVFFLVFQFIPQ